MSTERKIAPTLRSNPAAVNDRAAVSYVACTEYPYMMVRAMDWTAALGVALARLRGRVAPRLERRRHERAVARARVVERGGAKGWIARVRW